MKDSGPRSCSSSPPQLASFSALHYSQSQTKAATASAQPRSAPREIRAAAAKMFDDQDLGFFTNFLGIFIFVLVIAYHFVMADPKYEGN